MARYGRRLLSLPSPLGVENSILNVTFLWPSWMEVYEDCAVYVAKLFSHDFVYEA